MPSWYIKASIQGILSVLPQSHRWNYFLQRYVSKSFNLTDRHFKVKLGTVVRHLAYYEEQRSQQPNSVLELGTGWMPIVPIGLYLCGVNRITTVDIFPHLQDIFVKKTIQKFLEHEKTGQLAGLLPSLQPERIEGLQEQINKIDSSGGISVLETLSITSLTVDVRNLKVPLVDLIISNNTLEHIPGPEIEEIFGNFRKLLNQDGLMSHTIDLADHYSYFDHNITEYNFLKFSPTRWRFFNPNLHYQNRLRVTDYRNIHKQSGFEILTEDNKVSSHSIDGIPLAQEFLNYDRKDVMVIRSWIVSTPVKASAD